MTTTMKKDETATTKTKATTTMTTSTSTTTATTTGTTTATTTTTPVFGKWVVLTASVVTFALGIGTPSSMSVLFLDWQDSFQVSRARTSAVHSCCIGIAFGGSVIPGYFMNRFGARPVILTGSILGTVGMVLSMFATSIDFLIATTGVIGGAGFCFIQLPIIPCVTSVAKTYKTTVISLCLVVSSVYIIINRYVLTYLADSYGWRMAYTYIAGCVMNAGVGGMVITSVVTTRTRLHQDTPSPSSPTLGTSGHHLDNNNGDDMDDDDDGGGYYVKSDDCLIKTIVVAAKAKELNDILLCEGEFFGGGEGGGGVRGSEGGGGGGEGEEEERDYQELEQNDPKDREEDTSRHSERDINGDDRKIISSQTENEACVSIGTHNIDANEKYNSNTDYYHHHNHHHHHHHYQTTPEISKDATTTTLLHQEKDCLMAEKDPDHNTDDGVEIDVITKTSLNSEPCCCCSSSSYRIFAFFRNTCCGSSTNRNNNNNSNNNLRFLTDIIYILHTAHVTITVAGIFSLSLIQMDYSRTAGFAHSTGVSFLTTVSISSMVGRICCGVIDFFPRIGSFPATFVASAIGALAILLLSFASDISFILCALCLLGFSEGVLLTIYPKCILDIDSVDQGSYPIALGLACTLEGVMDFLIPIAIGSSVDATGSYLYALVVLGCLSAMTTSVLVVCYLYSRNKSEKVGESGEKSRKV